MKSEMTPLLKEEQEYIHGGMDYVEKLLVETDYLQIVEKLEQLEDNRKFCRHGLSHLLDTARIAWMRVLEERLSTKGQAKDFSRELLTLEKEEVYLAALLHDLGRVQEYEERIPHHRAGVQVAARLLNEIGYPKEKALLVGKAMEGHRGQDTRMQTGEVLEQLLRWADKKSRNCFFCRAQEACKWEQEKRNRKIEY